ncbi:Ras GTPase, partial [Reticulomyxa filosa]
ALFGDVDRVLVGNKCDLSDQRQVPVAKGEEIAKKWHVDKTTILPNFITYIYTFMYLYFVCIHDRLLTIQTIYFVCMCDENCPFFESSAKERINVEAVFEQCVREIRKQRDGDVQADIKQETKASGGCCVVL